MGKCIHLPIPRKGGARRGSRIFKTIYVPRARLGKIRKLEKELGRGLTLREYEMLLREEQQAKLKKKKA